MITGNFEGISNLATWTGQIEFVSNVTGVAWFTTIAPPTDITLRLRDRETMEVVVEGSLSGGQLVIVDDGLVTYTFAPAIMSGLAAQSYDCGGRYTGTDGVVAQYFLGSINVYEGL